MFLVHEFAIDARWNLAGNRDRCAPRLEMRALVQSNRYKSAWGAGESTQASLVRYWVTTPGASPFHLGGETDKARRETDGLRHRQPKETVTSIRVSEPSVLSCRNLKCARDILDVGLAVYSMPTMSMSMSVSISQQPNAREPCCLLAYTQTHTHVCVYASLCVCVCM
jgi:hypothetical protein